MFVIVGIVPAQRCLRLSGQFASGFDPHVFDEALGMFLQVAPVIRHNHVPCSIQMHRGKPRIQFPLNRFLPDVMLKPSQCFGDDVTSTAELAAFTLVAINHSPSGYFAQRSLNGMIVTTFVGLAFWAGPALITFHGKAVFQLFDHERGQIDRAAAV